MKAVHEPPVRIELTTYALQVRCSTTELGRLGHRGDRSNYGSRLVNTEIKGGRR